ncbi:hypothetical protein [Streptomyces sp. NPDC005760]|uniref:hypothetical protein n=1 Tax=Streptomyces sp. NPDC005760 TaxID=3156718 RepID=UPI0033DE160D
MNELRSASGPLDHKNALIPAGVRYCEVDATLVRQLGEGVVDSFTHAVALTPTAQDVTATRGRYTHADGDRLDFVRGPAAIGQGPAASPLGPPHRAEAQSTPPASSWNSSVQ